jgi:hypothetical protein
MWLSGFHPVGLSRGCDADTAFLIVMQSNSDIHALLSLLLSVHAVLHHASCCFCNQARYVVTCTVSLLDQRRVQNFNMLI